MPADKARIIVLRLKDSYIGGRWARLDIDGAAVGKLGREQFLVIDTVPGEREISVDEGEAKGRFVLKRNFEAQQIYDLQVSRREEHKKYEATGMFAFIGELIAPLLNGDKGLFILEPVPAWQVLKMLENLELSE